MLDIGTGNGPLPKLLLGMASRPDLQCDAIDLAEIAPPWVQELSATACARVRFHSACAAEQLPFGAASFELVVSQWGLEYSHLGLSVPEILRVLAPGGAVQLLLHHQDALPVTLAADEIAHLEWLLQDSPYLDVASQMLAPMALTASPAGRAQLMQDPGANHLRALFNAQQDAMQARIEHGACTDVLVEVRQAVGEFFAVATQQGVVIAAQAFSGLRATLEDSLLRLRELREHAMDEVSVSALGASLAEGRPYQISVLRDQDAIMGWALLVSRAA